MSEIIISKRKKVYYLFSAYLLSIIVYFIIYKNGGTIDSYANLMYLPIIIVALTGGKRSAVVIAVFNGVLIGPTMPLDVVNHIMPDSSAWLLRLSIYIIIAFITGFLADYYKMQYIQNIEQQKELSKTQGATINALVELTELRDDDTGQHIERVALFSKVLTSKLEDGDKYRTYINDDYVENVYKASKLHDIGKVGIPDNILLKKGKLNDDEFAIMEKHTLIGAKTLYNVKKDFSMNTYLDLGISITNFHHERWDGEGYPAGLSGEHIPLSARIVSIADVYDALRSKRSYKEGFSHKKSVEIIESEAGTHFDPYIAEIFLENQHEFEIIFENNSSNNNHIFR